SNSNYGAFFEGGGLMYSKKCKKITLPPRFCRIGYENGVEKIEFVKNLP
ncbi:hypothetical protein MNBD_CHLOROFLEXI01-3806, partial [hydrothermal vent metagenome]